MSGRVRLLNYDRLPVVGHYAQFIGPLRVHFRSIGALPRAI